VTDQLREKLLAMKCACFHKYGWHEGDGSACYYGYADGDRCICDKFIPSDNLTWMEYEAEKRGLI